MECISEGPQYNVWGGDEVLYGPVGLLTMVDWVREGRLTADCWVYQDSRRSWGRAGLLDELKPLFEEVERTLAIALVSAARGGVNSEILERVKLFAGFNDAQLVAFLQYMEILTLEPYAYAVREGEHGDAMFLILEGELRVQLTRDSKDTRLTALYSGDFFGEVALLDHGPRSADVIANERSTLLKISATAFAKLRQEAPTLAEPFLFSLARSLATRLRLTNKRYDGSVKMLQSLEVVWPL